MSRLPIFSSLLLLALPLCAASFNTQNLDIGSINTHGLKKTLPTTEAARHFKSPPKAPDLTVQSIRVRPGIKEGDEVGRRHDITITVKNLGRATAGKSRLKVVVREPSCPKVLNGSVTIPPLRPGAGKIVHWPQKPSRLRWKKGTCTLNARISLLARTPSAASIGVANVQESNLRNNRKIVKVRIHEGPKPDLAIKKVRQSGRICAGKSASSTGQVDITVANLSRVDAPATTVRVTCRKGGAAPSITRLDTAAGCPSGFPKTLKLHGLKAGKSVKLRWPGHTARKWKAGHYVVTFEVNPSQRSFKEEGAHTRNNLKSLELKVAECALSIPSGLQAHKAPPPPKTPEKIHKIPLKKAPPKVAFAPRFKGLEPGRWEAGRRYTVTLSGEHLKRSWNYAFDDSGIRIEKVRYLNDRHVELRIAVDKKARSKRVKLRYSDNKEAIRPMWAATGLEGWVVARATRPGRIPKFHIAPITPDITFPKGRIILESPAYGKDRTVEMSRDRGIPALNDRTLFTFREENPGLADRFVLEITNRRGEVLLSRDLGKEKAYRPDPAFIVALQQILANRATAAVRKGLKKRKWELSLPKGVSASGGFKGKKRTAATGHERHGGAVVNLPKGSLKSKNVTSNLSLVSNDKYILKHLRDIDLFWRVKGQRSYRRSGVVLSDTKRSDKRRKETVTLTVEESEMWPLRVQNFVPGLGCGRDGGLFSLQVVNLDLGTGQKKGETGTVNYTGDRIKLTGSFDTAKAPWGNAADCDAGAPPTYKNGVLEQNLQCRARNFYVSWGDGTVERLAATGRGKKLTVDDAKMRHRYFAGGTYRIRVFMLPESEVQHTDPTQVVTAWEFHETAGKAAAKPAVHTAGAGGSPYATLLQLSGEFPKPSPSLVDIAKHAYMIYCHTLEIREVQDVIAGGPLHLEELRFTGYNGGKAKAPPGHGKLDLEAPGRAAMNLGNQRYSRTGLRTGLPGDHAVAGGEPAPSFSACDSLRADAELTYYGKGEAKVRWLLEGGGKTMVLGERNWKIGPSRARKGLSRQSAKEASYESWDTYALHAPLLRLESFKLGDYRMRVSARVDTTSVMAMSQRELMQVFRTPSSRKQRSKSTRRKDPYLAAFAGGEGKLGILSPSKRHVPGFPAVASFAKAANRLTGLRKSSVATKMKPYYVEAAPFAFDVGEKPAGSLCLFRFPTRSGTFTISNIAKTVKEVSPGVYSGTGTMIVRLNADTADNEITLPVTIDRWHVAPNLTDVTRGRLDSTLEQRIEAGGMKIDLKRVAAEATKTPLNLTLDIQAQDTALQADAKGSPLVYRDITEPLSEGGDWYHEEKREHRYLIGWSGFTLRSKSVVLDLDTHKGRGIQPQCGGAPGAAWTGIHLGGATLVPNTFDLVMNGYTKTVTDWGITDGGLCGQTTFGPFKAALQKGSVAFKGIKAAAKGGSFYAVYDGMDIHLPWPDLHMKGSALLTDGVPGEMAKVSFRNLKPDRKAEVSLGPVRLRADNLVFGNYEGVGWGAVSSALFEAEAEKRPLASPLFDGLVFGMDGRIHGQKDETHATAPLGGKGRLGDTPLTLRQAELQIEPKGDRLATLVVHTDISISEKMETVPVAVRYPILAAGDTRYAQGPLVDKFDVHVAFPSGQPNVETTVHTGYTGPQQSAHAYLPSGEGACYAGLDRHGLPVYSDVPLIDRLAEPGELYATAGELYADNRGAAAGDRFNGDIDLAMYGGPPVRAEFRLGYKNGRDYWLMRSTLDLGPTGVAFVPPLLNLYKIRGGLGYNFPVDAFKHVGTINDVYPDMGGNYLFMAGVRVGSPDNFTAHVDGDLTISTGKAARLDFRSWILRRDTPGEGEFHGYFQYGAGSFDGTMEGKKNFLDGKVVFTVPKNAVDIHVGHGDWHFYFGKKEGPRIKMYMLIMESDGYVMLDPDALATGNGVHYHLEGKLGYVDGRFEQGMRITPKPHIDGFADGSVTAKVCCCHCCIGPTIDAHVEAGALPVYANCHACFTMDLKIKTVHFCGDFSL